MTITPLTDDVEDTPAADSAMSAPAPAEEEHATPRAWLAAALRAALPEWTIIDAPREADSISKKTILLWTSTATRLEKFSLTHVEWNLETWVTVPQPHDPAAFEERLDAALLEYLYNLEGNESTIWATAQRGTLANTIEGYRVEVTVAFPFTYQGDE